MKHTKSTYFILGLSLLAGLACGPGLCQGESEFQGNCQMIQDLDTQTLSKTQGGLLHLVLPSTNGKGPTILNQTSITEYYILGKLVQAGVASLDLILAPASQAGDYQAQVNPTDLQAFQLGPAEIDLTTPDGVITKPITID